MVMTDAHIGLNELAACGTRGGNGIKLLLPRNVRNEKDIYLFLLSR